MVSFGIGLERLRAKIPDIHFKKVIILSFSSMIAFHVLFSPSPISRLFLTDKVWGYGWSAYVPNDRNDRIQAAIRLYIPSDKNIVVSVQNTIVTYDLMRRDNVFVFPDGIFNPAEGRATDVKVLNNFIGYINDKNPPLIYPSFFADYVVVDFKRPLFINDRGCGWQYGKCLDLKHVDKFKKIFSQVVENGEIIWKDDEMYIVHLDRSSKGSNNL